MKKLYTILSVFFCGLTAIANASNGSVSFQIDQNMGSENPDLLPAETEEVTGSFEDGVLKITQMPYGFLPVEFTIDMETGNATAVDQKALEEDGIDFYYYNLETKEPELVGIVSNIGNDKCQLVLQPWGPGDYFSGFGVYFTVVFYNTIFTFDFSIPGLDAAVDVPMLEIESVNYETVNSEYGIYFEFTVEVAAENIPEGNDIKVYYKGPYDDDFKMAVENVNGSFSFSLGGLEPNVDYTLLLYAQAGSVTSEIETYMFNLEQAAINSLREEDTTSIFYDINGVKVKNLQSGGIYIKVNNGYSEKIMIK